jgi:hypothetical protein
VLLADRFGGTPFAYWEADAIEMQRLLNLLGLEGEVAEAIGEFHPDNVFGYGPDGYAE